MDNKIKAMRFVGRVALEGKLISRSVEDAEFLDDCIQVFTGCRFGESGGCTHEDCE